MTYPQQPHHQQSRYVPTPQHGPYDQPGPYGHPPVKRGKGALFWLFIVGLPLVVLASCTAAIAVIGMPSARQPAADGARPAASGDAQQPQRAARIGDEVRDGVFAFTVNRVERVKRVGGEFLHKDAQGEFLVVHVAVWNAGDRVGHFLGSNQKVYDADGREYSADSGAAMYLPESKSLYEAINPGNRVDGIILFDLPTNVIPAAIMLRESMFSEGVRVELGDQ